MYRQYALSIVLLMASMQHLDAFAPSLSIQRPPSVPTNLFMSEEPEMGAENPEAAEAGEPVEEEVPEDPEIVALKEEIAKLESELKSKQSTLAYTQDQVEEYSKTGYARKVAEMENMRRVRNNINSSSRSNAIAGVLADFLPAYDKMGELRAKYAGDEFGSKYGGLSIEDTFAKMGVTEYSAEAGQPVDNIRMVVLETEYSDEIAKGIVIRPTANGMELEGNVIRAAQCVASYGSEAEAAAEEANAEAAEEDLE